MLTRAEKAEQWRARRADDEQWAAEQEAIRRVKSGELAVVDRARFERLREYVAAHEAKENAASKDAAYMGYACSERYQEGYRLASERAATARHKLQPGDLDPLP